MFTVRRILALPLLGAPALASPSGRLASDPSLQERSFSYPIDNWVPIATHGLMLPMLDDDGFSDGLPIILPTGHDSSAHDASASSIFGSKTFFSHIDISQSSASRYDYVAEWEPSVNPWWEHDVIEDDRFGPGGLWKRAHSRQSRDIRRRDGVVTLLPATTHGNSTVIEAQSLVDHRAPANPRRMQKRSIRWHRPHRGDRHSAKVEALAKLKEKSEKKRIVGSGATISTTVTWYSGQDLKNPYCDRKSHWTPTDNSLIVAVTQEWPERPACGEFLEVALKGHGGKPGKSVTVRVVDLCGGCRPGVAHADLSKAAFSSLLDLDVGLKSGLLMRKVAAPKEWDEALYGPKVL